MVIFNYLARSCPMVIYLFMTRFDIEVIIVTLARIVLMIKLANLARLKGLNIFLHMAHFHQLVNFFSIRYL